MQNTPMQEKHKKENGRDKALKKRKKTFGGQKSDAWLALAVFDLLAGNLAYGLGLWLRFDMQYMKIPLRYLRTWIFMAPIQAALILLLFTVFRLYRSMWRYAGIEELECIAAATGIAALLHVAVSRIWFVRMPISYYVIGWLLEFLMLAGIRYSVRFFSRLGGRRQRRPGPGENVMVIGAGEGARLLIRELKGSDKISVNVCCAIDDDQKKRGKFLNGVPIVGDRRDILKNVERFDIQKIILAIPTLSAGERKEILEICKESGCRLQTLPGVYQLLNDELIVSKLRDVSLEELLGREPVRVDLEEIMGYVRGKTILVTGGGGSIGSELCRQIAGHKPGQLIIFDIYENNAYEIQQELKRSHPGLDVRVLIGSVRDTKRIEHVFEKYHPNIVYHAAAHKHVPLMEHSPGEAVKNNVLGTYKTSMAAGRHGTERFVLISTDKAVNPTNIMGASKRLCEMVIQAANSRFGTEYVAVRFGNVLGSNGSVIPLFQKQIACGGPVTVTDQNIVRYFMTIPEAVSLVLQAGAYAKGGEIFVLDMGDPVKIDDLARNLIRLSGYVPEEDIPIVYTGLREGEKMYEECLKAEEGLEKTPNQLIFIGKPLGFEKERLLERIPELTAFCDGEAEEIKALMKEFVPSYREAEEVRATAEDKSKTEAEENVRKAAAGTAKNPAEMGGMAGYGMESI